MSSRSKQFHQSISIHEYRPDDAIPDSMIDLIFDEYQETGWYIHVYGEDQYFTQMDWEDWFNADYHCCIVDYD